MAHYRGSIAYSSGYITARRLLCGLQELLVGAQRGAEFHAGLSVTSVSPHTATIRTTKTCAKRVRVVLSCDVEGVGKAGESVLVASGYARNFLVPHRMARLQVGEEAVRGGRTRHRGLSFAAMKYMRGGAGVEDRAEEDVGEDVDARTSAEGATMQQVWSTPSTSASMIREQLLERQKREAKKLENIVRKLTENPVVFKGIKRVNGVLETTIGPSEIRVATAKQLGIDIVDELIDMEGDVLDVPGDFLIPLKLVLADNSKAKMNVRILGE